MIQKKQHSQAQDSVGWVSYAPGEDGELRAWQGVSETPTLPGFITLGLQVPSEKVGLGSVPGGSKYLLRRGSWLLDVIWMAWPLHQKIMFSTCFHYKPMVPSVHDHP